MVPIKWRIALLIGPAKQIVTLTGMSEDQKTKSENSSRAAGSNLHERVERLQEKASRSSETLAGSEETLDEASKDFDD